MSTWMIVVLIVLLVLGILLVVLSIFGNKMQKKQIAQKEMMKEAAQLVSMLVIDKKMMKIKEAGLPKQVLEQTPKRFRNSKLPIVKAKVGPQTINLICDDGIYDDLPTKCEVKAMVSGIYITEVKSIRGKKKKQRKRALDKNFVQNSVSYRKRLHRKKKRKKITRKIRTLRRRKLSVQKKSPNKRKTIACRRWFFRMGKIKILYKITDI